MSGTSIIAQIFVPSHVCMFLGSQVITEVTRMNLIGYDKVGFMESSIFL